MRIWIFSLESVETRYTCEWRHSIPVGIQEEANNQGRRARFLYSPLLDRRDVASDGNIFINEVEIAQLEGTGSNQVTTPGAFLNFAGTNVWKSSQLALFCEALSKGLVKRGDKVLFADAWNPVILQVKYMNDLLGLGLEIHSIWHAGSYDPQDFLGRLIKDKRWTISSEKAMFFASDYNYFATEFHINLFFSNLFYEQDHKEAYKANQDRVVLSGQPHQYMKKRIEEYTKSPKEDIVLFPHRVAPEKQPDIFRDLAKSFPHYEFIVCQDQKLSKEEYHNLLLKSKIVFSANLQETLGISAMEAILAGSTPLVPDRLSYSEMYMDQFKYPSEWTKSWEDYLDNKKHLVRLIQDTVNLYNKPETHMKNIEKQKLKLDDYLSAGVMFKKLLNFKDV